MRINIKENRLAQATVCLLILAFAVGANYLIYIYKKPSGRSAVTVMGGVGEAWSGLDRAEMRDAISRRAGEAVVTGNGASRREKAFADPDWAQEMVRVVAWSDPLLHSASFINAEGAVLAHTQGWSLSMNFAHRSYFKKAMAGENATEIVRIGSSARVFKISVTPVKIDGVVVGALCMLRKR